MAHVNAIAVIGCGNLARSDDGVGPQVVRALARRAVAADPRVRLLDAGTDGMAVMFAARDCRTLIVLDAARSGATPGAVFELPGREFENDRPPSLSVHEFRWDHALYAGRRMYGESFPSDVTVLLVEAQSTDFGTELSPSVAAAADIVTERVERLLHERLGVAA
jgi:hydrogenase maturation protease